MARGRVGRGRGGRTAALVVALVAAASQWSPASAGCQTPSSLTFCTEYNGQTVSDRNTPEASIDASAEFSARIACGQNPFRTTDATCGTQSEECRELVRVLTCQEAVANKGRAYYERLLLSSDSLTSGVDLTFITEDNVGSVSDESLDSLFGGDCDTSDVLEPSPITCCQLLPKCGLSKMAVFTANYTLSDFCNTLLFANARTVRCTADGETFLIAAASSRALSLATGALVALVVGLLVAPSDCEEDDEVVDSEPRAQSRRARPSPASASASATASAWARRAAASPGRTQRGVAVGLLFLLGSTLVSVARAKCFVPKHMEYCAAYNWLPVTERAAPDGVADGRARTMANLLCNQDIFDTPPSETCLNVEDEACRASIRDFACRLTLGNKGPAYLANLDPVQGDGGECTMEGSPVEPDPEECCTVLRSCNIRNIYSSTAGGSVSRAQFCNSVVYNDGVVYECGASATWLATSVLVALLSALVSLAHR